MQHYFAIAALFFAVLLASVPVKPVAPDVGSVQAQDNGALPNLPASTAAAPPPSGTIARDLDSANPHNDADANDHPERISAIPNVSIERDLFDYLSAGFSAALVAIGFFGVRYAKRTLADIKRQADTMEAQAKEAGASAVIATEIARKTAEAASLNAQAVINSERPWLIVDAKGFPNVTFTMKNKGRTPAQLIWYDPCT